jgi:hydrogenase nickel incorporation protein HypA/HybF
MHELGVAASIYRSSREAVRAHGAGRLEVVRVAIGELAAVEPELLQTAWQVVTSDGPDAGARLEIRWHAARQHCASCGEQRARAAGSWLRLCPDCQMPLHVEGGDELDLLQVEYEPEGAAS